MSTAHERVKNYHAQAFESISHALQQDEDPNGDKEEATEWYIQGIEQLENGIQEQCLGASHDDKEKIARLQVKMKKNLAMAKERLEILVSNSSGKENNKFAKPTTTCSKNNAAKSTKSKTKVRSASPSTSSSSYPKPVSKVRNVKPPRPKSNTSAVPSPKVNSNRTTSGSSLHQTTNSTPLKKRVNLKSIPTELVNRILDQAIDAGESTVSFADVAGQETAKQALKEIVILPQLRPELFTGLRSPAKGLLLFGPPGNGKTLLAKAVASEAKSVFFNISAATLTSKWVGEGEKLVKTLFAVAKELQPSIIFIDEIDSLLCERQEGEQDSTRRLKTEFLLQFDGVGSSSEDRILVMGATNRPHELDDAVLRRFPKRVYVQLPDLKTREHLLNMLLNKHHSPLPSKDMKKLSQQTEHYSCSDLTALAKDAALGPIREIPSDLIVSIDAKKMRSIQYKDFEQSIKRIRPSVSLNLLQLFEKWNLEFGDTTPV